MLPIVKVESFSATADQLTGRPEGDCISSQWLVVVDVFARRASLSTITRWPQTANEPQGQNDCSQAPPLERNLDLLRCLLGRHSWGRKKRGESDQVGHGSWLRMAKDIQASGGGLYDLLANAIGDSNSLSLSVCRYLLVTVHASILAIIFKI